MNKIITTLIFCTCLLTLNGCKKYSDGPMFSFRSAEARLCKKWILKAATLNGNPLLFGTGTYETIIEYKTDGSVILTGDSRLLQGNQIGTWSLIDNNTKLTTDFNGNVQTKEIIRLTNSDLWFSDINSLGNYIEKYGKH
jgi:hypothetical protein